LEKARAKIGSHIGLRAKALTDERVLCRPSASISGGHGRETG